MELLSIPPGGAWLAARWFALLPLVVAGVAWVALRVQGRRAFAGLGRVRRLLLALLLIGYYGVIWNWLFHDQFYGIVQTADGQWHATYRVPARKVVLDPRQVVRLGQVSLTSVTGGATTGRIVLELADGRRLRSAQLARHRIPGRLAALRAALPGRP